MYVCAKTYVSVCMYVSSYLLIIEELNVLPHSVCMCVLIYIVYVCMYVARRSKRRSG